jgi:hypothetical protein
MKKLILCGSALLLSLTLLKAQGVTSTGAYDDFQDADPSTDGMQPYTPADALGIYWWGGTRTAGQLSVPITAGATPNYFGVDFGKNTAPDPDVKLPLNLSSMADVQFDVENTHATKHVSVRVVLEDADGTQTQIEPNISDAEATNTEGVPLTGVYWPEGQNGGDPAVYPKPAYNGFILPANTRRTIRIDLSSVPGNVGGRIAGAYTAGDPATMPASTPGESNGFDASKVFAILLIMNEGTNYLFSNGATDKGSYRYDSIAAAGQTDYTGTLIFRSFKIGSTLSALPDAPLGVNEAIIDNSLSVYPNPANEILNVSFKANNGAEVSLTDIVGNRVYSTSAFSGENKINVNTSSLSSGMYILNITTENGTVARKVTIK